MKPVLKVLAVVTARGGSKGIPRKNIRLLCGKPLLQYTAEAALNARTYADDGRIVIGVRDTFCPWNTGTYAIEGGRCRRTDADPSLVAPAEALGACYLGGIRFSTLVRAGVVTERRPGAAERADGLFRSAEVPWCPFHF